MGKRGPRPDLKRRQEVRHLRARGMTLEAIGQRLGVSRQAVFETLKKDRKAGQQPQTSFQEGSS